MSIATEIRTFFHELFGSRVADVYREQLLTTRMDYDHRLMDKDRVIDDLKVEIARLNGKLALLETVVIPVLNPLGEKPTFQSLDSGESSPSSWQNIQSQWYAKQEKEQEEIHAEK